ncbi:glycosyltransferase family 2 protein [Limosilactobacillus vaginalis]|uniref:glycosyltransferase family 2 protein n=1 Tax=Limosilactobacillus vaginalis TaxID=1633 RepID=UPI003C6CD3CD
MRVTPLISIIIPVYNTDKYLERCLSSVTNQTYQNIEIIIVDDGSTDKSPTIIKKYVKKIRV